jgi:RNA polymerase sigma factor (sigma-70 family)
MRDLDADPELATLTDREREIAELAARGMTNREVAERLHLSVRTVHTHLQRAYAKLGVHDRERLAELLAAGSAGGC